MHRGKYLECCDDGVFEGLSSVLHPTKEHIFIFDIWVHDAVHS